MRNRLLFYFFKQKIKLFAMTTHTVYSKVLYVSVTLPRCTSQLNNVVMDNPVFLLSRIIFTQLRLRLKSSYITPIQMQNKTTNFIEPKLKICEIDFFFYKFYAYYINFAQCCQLLANVSCKISQKIRPLDEKIQPHSNNFL
jgi:hypothetical protein